MGKRSNNRYKRPSGVPRGRNITVTNDSSLLAFLFEELKDQSKSSVKALLHHGQISVNGNVTTQFDAPLAKGDIIWLSYERGKVEFNHPKVEVIWEDQNLLVVLKKSGILTVGNSKTNEKTTLELLDHYVKKNDPRSKVFLLHTLEKEASGLLLFAKTRAIQQLFQSNWNQLITQRTFVVAVEGQPEKETGLLTSQEGNITGEKVYITSAGRGKGSIVRYRVKKSNQRYSLLELSQEAGLKNEIRYLLGSAGIPVVGDIKNGSETDFTGRLAMHADRLCFINPENDQEQRYEVSPPSSFGGLLVKKS